MKTILYINTIPYIGGAEMCLLAIAKKLPRNHYTTYIVTSGEGSLSDKAAEIGIKVSLQEFPWFSKRKPWQYTMSILQLARLIKNKSISLVHTNCDHSLQYAMHACRLTNTRYVSHVHDNIRPWFSPKNLHALNRASTVIANSNSVADICNANGVMKEKIQVIYNGFELEQYENISPTAIAQIRSNIGIPTDAIVVGLVGQIQPEKGQFEFVHAGIRLLEQNPNLHFIISGEVNHESLQTYYDNLSSMVEDSGFASNFHFTGFRHDIPEIMRVIDILTVPSHSEAFGRVAVEGMLSGCAVIASNIGGLVEIITNGVDGLLIPPQNWERLTEAVYRLTVNEQLRKELALNGKKTAKHFSIENQTNQVALLYESIIDGY